MSNPTASLSPTDPVYRWLVFSCWFTIAFGAMCAATTVPGLQMPVRTLVDVAFWPLDGWPGAITREGSLPWGILGGVMIGWGSMMLGITRHATVQNQPWLWRTMLLSLFAWYVPDSTASVLSGGWGNAVLNTGFLLMFVVPLMKLGALRTIRSVALAT